MTELSLPRAVGTMAPDGGENIPLTKIREENKAAQARAASADHSAWVSANAGSGKTYVLVRRVLSLMLAGASPQSILCLTFTKAAAAEMANRLIAQLGRWAVATESDLSESLRDLGCAPDADRLDQARRLFAQTVETPGGLRIMTIHAFCDSVLRRFPLEAGVSPGFAILTEEDAVTLRREAADAVLNEAASRRGSALGQGLTRIAAYASEDRFDDLLSAALARRAELKALIQQQETEDPFTGINEALRRSMGLGAEDRPERLSAAQAALCSKDFLTEAVAALDEGKVTDRRLAAKLAAARLAKTAAEAMTALAGAFLTTEGKPRKDGAFVTKDVAARRPVLTRRLREARDAFAHLDARFREATAAEATDALLRLTDAVLTHYEAAKAARSCLDYDDLIARTISVLTAEGGAGWVLYRLDGGIDHLLVDEAQDTSPTQWEAITRLTAEFFVGQGARDSVRTVFAVGDEKQSIYSFQGAEPKMFAEMGLLFRMRAEAAGLACHEAPLSLSYRSTTPVLRAVDLVFRDPARTPGLSAQQRTVRHHAHRAGEAGLVEIWPVEQPSDAEASEIWLPFDEAGGQPRPADRVAARIAGRIRTWLDEAEPSLSRGRPIEPGDILILVRKREPFTRPMIRELKARGVPVAGSDRMRLTEELAVQDLMSLGDFVLLPEDDLALACLLKSPAFDFTDDDLFAAGHGREGSLWRALRARAGDNALFSGAVERLQGWLNQADQIPPYEFFIERLENEGLSAALIARLGPEAADSIGEFLDLALKYEENAIPSLQGFLHWLRQNAIEIKRDMEQGRNEVRVMTVHGAKGLEADIVFLPDTCSTRSADGPSLLVFAEEGARPGAAKQFLWTPSACGRIATATRVRERKSAAEREEYHRLLYVAMTRARDRLYVCGYEGRSGRNAGCWYDLIREGLADAAREDPDGVLRFETPAVGNEIRPHRNAGAGASPAPPALPAWLAAPAPAEAVRPGAVTATELGRREDSATPRSRAPGGENARERGLIVHRLLELLPAAPGTQWDENGRQLIARQDAARRLLAALAPALSSAEHDLILDKTLAILRNPRFAPLWGPGSRAEVALSAELPPHRPGGPALRISGRVDRLAVLGESVYVVDYKTSGTPPRRPEDAPRPHLLQMAAYRLAVRAVFPDKAIHCAILWTAEAALMEIPAPLLESLSQTDADEVWRPTET